MTHYEYEGKFFYEIIRQPDGVKLVGPLDTIRFVTKSTQMKHEYSDYAFVEVVNGQVVHAYLESEILVTDKIL